jgi:DNA-binding XRE family transcriptional regulator
MRPSKNPQPALGLAIRQLRIKRGETQVGLAKEAGITSQVLSFIERGGTNPTWHTVKSLAAALEITMVQMARMTEKTEADSKGNRDKS